ncbi:double-stranded RNA-binding protein 6 [Amborella trichopoda]|uniref:DRBM domain-containing protein n=1 Tax=Amborella trichopoda TaxID=13333 RepID=W1PKZ5_AMBTC|nr:double-stranded RNA-binding protein 6 [Amborella trichopoda]ERN08356.1 hypothetical protein AMTR_s00148p00030810 [Amborella trichopoda]|eukprot:XP_006846775.1 double-stranded RNA-binding protein 6 [Amborella trichopoda]
MYKNQLQELAQRSCFNLPSYSCIREGPDHAPRFKAAVNFNGEVFESPGFCTTLRQAEHAAAEVALNTLSNRGPSQSLAARILDETGVYKNLLQEIAQRAGAALPVYTTVRSGLGHLPVFTCTVELAGISFSGEPAKSKKQAEKNAAMAAWSSLKKLAQQQQAASSFTSSLSSPTSSEGATPSPEPSDEQEQITIARALVNFRHQLLNNSNKSNPCSPSLPGAKLSFPNQHNPKPFTQNLGSKILPLIRQRQTQRPNPHAPPFIPPENRILATQAQVPASQSGFPATQNSFPAGQNRISAIQTQIPAGVGPVFYPVGPAYRPTVHHAAPPVTIRNAIPVFSARPSHVRMPPPVQVRHVAPVFTTGPMATAPKVGERAERVDDKVLERGLKDLQI